MKEFNNLEEVKKFYESNEEEFCRGYEEKSYKCLGWLIKELEDYKILLVSERESRDRIRRQFEKEECLIENRYMDCYCKECR